MMYNTIIRAGLQASQCNRRRTGLTLSPPEKKPKKIPRMLFLGIFYKLTV